MEGTAAIVWTETVVDDLVEAPAAPPRPSRWIAVAALGLALVPALTYLVFAVLHPRRWVELLDDDAYYYLGVARNIAAGNGSTFAGLVETNGYHPLWLLILVPVAAVVRDPYVLVAVVFVIQSFIWIFVVREGMRIGRRFGSGAVGVLALVTLGLLAIVIGHLSFNGMESAPLVFFFVLAVRLALEADEGDESAYRKIGWVLALMSLTRLDATFTALLIAAALALRNMPPVRRDAVVRAVRLAGPTALGLGLYVVANTILFGTPTPVSGQAKSIGAPFFNGAGIRDFFTIPAGDRPSWLGIVLIGTIVVAGRLVRRDPTEDGRRVIDLLVAVTIAEVIFLAYFTFATSYTVLSWYRFNIAFMAFLAVLPVGKYLVDRFGQRADQALVIAAAAFLVLQAAGTFLSDTPVFPGSVPAVEFVDAELPDDAVLAMGDRAGLVGYFADRPMFQIEGLTADKDFVGQLREGTAPSRLTDEGVEYYMRYTHKGDGEPIGFGCARYAEPTVRLDPLFYVTACEGDLVYRLVDDDGSGQFSIWRYRPDIQDD
jgi:hypothetical protein